MRKRWIAEIHANQAALEAGGHWGVPTLVFDGEPFFGQDRIEMVLWRMQQKGLEKRSGLIRHLWRGVDPRLCRSQNQH
jgi:hypothetical protein